MRALITASLQAIFKSPSAIVFTIAFPLIFILVFGFLGNESRFSIKVAAAPGSDTTSPLYGVLRHIEVLKWADGKSAADIKKLLSQGDIVATIDVQKQPEGSKPQYKVLLNASSGEINKAKQLEALIQNVTQMADPEIRKRQDEILATTLHIAEAKEAKTIDFILPGQLSFSLLSSGVFGTAFIFFNMRQTLVLKRFFATPVRREIIVLSEGIARMLFQIIGSIIIISLGHYAFGFTLANGLVTFINLLAVCAIGLMVFMGFGFVISSIATNESVIPLFSNLVTLPQFLLAGTFFPIESFPKWLQPVCRIMPLTYVNDALRKIAFDGANLWTVRFDIFIVLIWGVAIYAITARLFKWE